MPMTFEQYWSAMVRSTPELSQCDQIKMDIPTFRDVVKAVFDRAREGMVVEEQPAREPIVFELVGIHRAE